MTCASCAARIEKRLNRIDGVTATVNFATEKAKVRYPQSVSPDSLVEHVADAGYAAHIFSSAATQTDRYASHAAAPPTADQPGARAAGDRIGVPPSHRKCLCRNQLWSLNRAPG
ncbi:cation transporter [Nocardia sp. NPDC051321]|uniref:cation transporter n=1 Tax=Nocardia sp. NPDC051321 TaxID=3364323 RepID=UPI00378E560C